MFLSSSAFNFSLSTCSFLFNLSQLFGSLSFNLSQLFGSLVQVAELRGVAAEKMALLDEFEKRFAEQYREWEGRAAELAEEVKVR